MYLYPVLVLFGITRLSFGSIVSVQGYTYCLDPVTGEQRWFNELEGMGVGVASLASVRGGSVGVSAQAAATDAARRQSD